MEESDPRKKTGEGTAFYGCIIESADYLMDMGISNQRKKGVRFDVEDNRWDENYVSFLVDLEDYFEAKSVEEDDNEDPTYAMFLENLKEHGKGYMLDVSIEHGVCTPIMYEVEPFKKKSLRTPLRTNIQKEGRLDVDQRSKSKRKYSSSVDRVETDPSNTVKKLNTKSSFDAKFKSGQKNSGFENVVKTNPSSVIKKKTSRSSEHYNFRKKARVEAKGQLKSNTKNSRPVNEVETDSRETSSRSSQHYNFRKKARVEAKGQLESNTKNSRPVNEVETDSRETSSRSSQYYNFRKKARVEAKGQLESNTKNSTPVNEVETDSRETSTTPHGYNMRKRGRLEPDKQLKSGLKDSAFVCKVEKDPLDVIEKTSISRQGSHIRKEGGSIKRKTSNSRQDGNIQKKGDIHVDRMAKSSSDALEVDETYKAFISGLKCIGESMVYEYGDHQQIFYEGNDQQMSTDDEIPNSCSRPTVPTPSLTEPITTPTPLSPTSNHNMPNTSEEPITTPTPIINHKMPNTSEEPITTPTPIINHNMPNTSEEPITTPTPIINHNMPNTSEEPITTPTPLCPTTNRNMPDTSVTDKANNKNGKYPQRDFSKFWRELQRIVSKPFDQNEFDDLWEAMRKRSEVQIYRESRSGGTYKNGGMGKSYLDDFPELNDEIEKVKSDSCKVLTLLRMLSFYLKKVPHGIPRPWMSAYLKMFLP